MDLCRFAATNCLFLVRRFYVTCPQINPSHWHQAGAEKISQGSQERNRTMCSRVHHGQSLSWGQDQSQRRRMKGASVAAVAVLCGLLLAASGQSATHTRYPVADAHVQQVSPNANYGTVPYLRIRHTASGRGQFSFLRFAIPNVPGNIVSADYSQAPSCGEDLRGRLLRSQHGQPNLG